MVDMRDREKAFEKKYALDQEAMFRIEARASKLFGLWLAGEAGMAEDEARAYAGTIVAANLSEPGFGDVKRAIRPLLDANNLSLDDAQIDAKLEYFMEQARLQLADGQA